MGFGPTLCGWDRESERKLIEVAPYCAQVLQLAQCACVACDRAGSPCVQSLHS